MELHTCCKTIVFAAMKRTETNLSVIVQGRVPVDGSAVREVAEGIAPRGDGTPAHFVSVLCLHTHYRPQVKSGPVTRVNLNRYEDMILQHNRLQG